MSLVNIQKALLLDDLASAISDMLALANEVNDNNLQNQIIHQSGRFHSNERGNNSGVISQDQYNRTRNQLRYALQEILKNFPGYTPEINLEAQKALAQNSAAKPETPSPDPPEDAFKILMLTSNPSGTGKLQLDAEHSRISAQIQNSANPARFSIRSKNAVTLPQFTEFLLEEKPTVVHFSGHGELNNSEIKKAINRGQGFDEGGELHENSTGIILTSDDGREPFFVSTPVIQRIFRTMVDRQHIPIKAVVFNSCYSEAQAEALAELIPHVIGTSWAVKDNAAIAFSNGFYSFLTRTENFEAAWDNGVNLALAYGEPEDKFIYFKNGKKVSI